jgi:hypothetical protein
MALQPPKYPNSAGRLLAVLGPLQNNQGLAQQLVPMLLDKISPTTDNLKRARGIRALAELDLMHLQFRRDMDAADINDDQKKVLLTGLTGIEQTIYPDTINGGPRILTEAEKSLLEVCATILPKESTLEKDDLSEIQASIASLRDQVKAADTSPTLKKILLELIRLSEDAINRFNIHGARGLKEAFKGMLAEIAELYYSTSDKEKEAIQATSTWAAITAHLRKFDEIGGKLLKYRPVLDHVATLLLGR